MAAATRPSTPPPRSAATSADSAITPEQVRRMEESKLKAKALREQRDRQSGASQPASTQSYPVVVAVAGQKRPHPSISSVPSSSRDARSPPGGSTANATAHAAAGMRQPNSNNGLAQARDGDIRAARKFQKYVEYDFSKMTDTKGGFMTQEDDPANSTLHAPEQGEKPANMSREEWERRQKLRRWRDQAAAEPGLSVLGETSRQKRCRECGTLEIDFHWLEVLHTQVCNTCKEKFPDRYSLLTKTEAKEDYLLTDPELKDEALLPHLEKPNPHKSTWNNMMLYLRFQVEEYAFSDLKWGSPEALDEEFERRQRETKQRKEKKFRNKLNELKKRTRVDAYKRGRAGGGGEFGDTIGSGRHEHEWGRSVEDTQTGVTRRQCIECGMEVEELEF